MRILAISSFVVFGFAATMFAYSSIGSYMDEIFHIPQAQRYCAGNFYEWDSKITTFPGLYLISASAYGILSSLIRQLLNIELSCSINFLRSINAFLALTFPIVVHLCRLKVEPDAGDSMHFALLAFLYPVNFFYYFLFYTDTASTLSILIVLYLVQNQLEIELNSEQNTKTEQLREDNSDTNDISGHFCSAYFLRSFIGQLVLLIASCASIMMRQTNAVWMLFIAGIMMLSLIERKKQFRDSKVPSLWRMIKFLMNLFKNAPYLIRVTWPLLMPVVAFFVFAVINRGIVVGDKEHHEPVYHLTMPLHACFMYALIMAPYSFIVPAITLISGLFENSSYGSRPLNNIDVSQGSEVNGDLQIKKIGNDDVIVSAQTCNVSRTSSDQNLSKYLGELLCIILKHSIGLMIVTYVLQHYTLSHPFLLADNRHYSFYLWSRILSKSHIRYFLSPLYYYCVQWCLTGFLKSRGFIWTVILILAVVITLVPAHLLELRYFSPAVVLAIIYSPPTQPCNIMEVVLRGMNHEGIVKRLKNKKETLKLFNHSYLLLSICICLIIDVLVIYIFLYKPFQWVDKSVARFMF